MANSDSQQRLLNRLNTASLGYAIGCIGQSLFLRLSPRPLQWIATAIICIPWFTAFLVTMCRGTPVYSRAFRWTLLFAACWYVAVTILIETVKYFGPGAADFPILVPRILMYTGSITSIAYLRAYFLLRQHEAKTHEKPHD
jgi:hypothetical protein